MVCLAFVLALLGQEERGPQTLGQEDVPKGSAWSVEMKLPALLFEHTLIRDPLGRPLADEILRHSDTALEASWSGTYTFLASVHEPTILLSASDTIRQRSWLKEEDFNLTSNDSALTATLPFPDAVVIQDMGFEYIGVGGEPYAQRIYGSSSLAFKGRGFTPMLGYEAFRDSYKLPATDAMDRDGKEHRFFVALNIEHSDGWELTVTARRFLFASEGTDFDRRAWVFAASVELHLAPQTEVTVSGDWTVADYPHANSADPLGTERSDRIAAFKVDVSHKVSKTVTLSGRIQGTSQRSDVAAFDYDHLIVSFGVASSF